MIEGHKHTHTNRQLLIIDRNFIQLVTALTLFLICVYLFVCFLSCIRWFLFGLSVPQSVLLCSTLSKFITALKFCPLQRMRFMCIFIWISVNGNTSQVRVNLRQQFWPILVPHASFFTLEFASSGLISWHTTWQVFLNLHTFGRWRWCS